MPVTAALLNEAADKVFDADILVRLHTGAPGNAGTANRVAAGGTNFTAGVTVGASGWSAASNGVVSNTAAIDFGTASGAPGTITHYSIWKGGTFYGWNTLQARTVASGDTYEISASSLSLTIS